MNLVILVIAAPGVLANWVTPATSIRIVNDEQDYQSHHEQVYLNLLKRRTQPFSLWEEEFKSYSATQIFVMYRRY